MPGLTFGQFHAVELGIQRGKESVQEIPGDVPKATFTAPLRVTGDASRDRPNFLGPYAHGTPADRFVYLSWSGLANGERTMFRRLKIRLADLTWDQIERAIAGNRPLVVKCGMTARDGGPACGTAHDDIEWEK